ncbi:amino acid ABC transporter permease [Phaeobacter inhibens]|uniref:amino acid ABC transporter permease n=1 Tax=Phaeobacter inhibens TaxID=221822 RepID=UPI0021A38DD1|nr:amino acid ABC transporter permease [Phaeobacter inhibens]
MSDTPKSTASPVSADAIIFQPKPAKAPPSETVGPIHWMRENLFYSWLSTAITLIGLYFIYTTVTGLYHWGVADAVWEASSRRECLDQSPHGACWAGISAWYNSIIYGRYPDEEQWRINLAFGLLIFWMLPIWLEKVQARAWFGISAVLIFPFLAGYLFAGGARGWFMQFALLGAIATLICNWLHAVLCVLTGNGLPKTAVALLGMTNKPDRLHKYALATVVVVIFAIVYAFFGSWEPVQVKTNLWGGLFLTFVIAGIGITVSLPMGILLALARRSELPAVKVLAVSFIELVRSVPLITVLFMAVTMVPLFLPQGVELNKLVQAIVGVCLFFSAYMAETVRGGLQVVAVGQTEAAKSLGLGYWKTMYLVVLPQALKAMIPNIVSNFIALFKDTTLVSIIGLYDMLLMLKAIGRNSSWIGLHHEPLIFGAAIYFIICFAMSKYSQHLENVVGGGASNKR